MAERRIAIQISVVGADDTKNKIKGVGKELGRTTHLQGGLTASFIKGNLAARGISASYVAMTRALKFASATVVDFEFAMKKLQAIKQLDNEETRKLEASIRAIAAVSPRTSTEVANAALSMVKLGVSADDVSKSLKGVIDLSVVLDEEVSRIGEVMVSVKNVYKRSASEMDETTNQLFTGFANSALTLEKFQTAFSFAGGAAESAGVSFEELISLMGILSSRGIRASTIGTQLKSVFLDLDDPTSKASKAIGNMTIRTDGLTKVIRELAKAELASFEIKDKFTKRSVNVVKIISEEGEAIKNLTSEVHKNSNALEEASKIINDTVEVVKKQAISAFADLAIEIGKLVTPTVISGLKTITRELNSLRTTQTGGSLDLANVDQAKRSLELVKKIESVRKRMYFLSVEDNIERDAHFQTTLRSVEIGNKLNVLRIKQNELLEEAKTLGLSISKNAHGQIKGLTGIVSSLEEDKRLEMISLKNAREKEQIEKRRKAIAKRSTLLGGGGGALPVDREEDRDLNRGLRRNRKDIQQFLKQGSADVDNVTDSVKLLNDEITIALIEAEALQRAFEQTFAGEITLGSIDILKSSIDQLSLGIGTNLVDNILHAKNIFKGFRDVAGNVIKAIISDMIALIIKTALLRVVFAALTGGGGGLADPGTFLGTVQRAFAPKASGFDGVVRRPTPMIVGEAGPERVSITPSAKTARQDADSGVTIVVQGSIIDKDGFLRAVNQANQGISRRFVNV